MITVEVSVDCTDAIKPERIKIMKRRISITLTILGLLLSLGMLRLWASASTPGRLVPVLHGSVAFSGKTAVVGAPFDAGAAGANQGSAYVFVRGGGVWS